MRNQPGLYRGRWLLVAMIFTLGLIFVSITPALAQRTADLTIQNATDRMTRKLTICGVFVSRPGANLWSANLLPRNVQITPGQTSTMQLQPASYDLLLEDCRNTVLLKQERVLIHRNGTWLTFDGSRLPSQRSVPPRGVATQLSLMNPAGAGIISCDAPSTARNCEVEITDELTLNFATPVSTVVVTDPNGSVARFSRGFDAVYLAPGMPLGIYNYEASSTRGTIRGAFTLKPSSIRVVMVRPVTGRSWDPQRPGANYTIDLAGFRPRQSVNLYLYQSNGVTHMINTGESEFVYLWSLGVSQVDARGEARLTYNTRGLAAGHYLVMSDPPMDRTNSSIEDLIWKASMFYLR
jgi:hypothetical protein